MSPDTGSGGFAPKMQTQPQIGINVDIVVCVNTTVYKATRRQKKHSTVKIPQRTIETSRSEKHPAEQKDLHTEGGEHRCNTLWLVEEKNHPKNIHKTEEINTPKIKQQMKLRWITRTEHFNSVHLSGHHRLLSSL